MSWGGDESIFINKQLTIRTQPQLHVTFHTHLLYTVHWLNWTELNMNSVRMARHNEMTGPSSRLFYPLLLANNLPACDAWVCAHFTTLNNNLLLNCQYINSTINARCELQIFLYSTKIFHLSVFNKLNARQTSRCQIFS